MLGVVHALMHNILFGRIIVAHKKPEPVWQPSLMVTWWDSEVTAMEVEWVAGQWSSNKPPFKGIVLNYTLKRRKHGIKSGRHVGSSGALNCENPRNSPPPNITPKNEKYFGLHEGRYWDRESHKHSLLPQKKL